MRAKILFLLTAAMVLVGIGAAALAGDAGKAAKHANSAYRGINIGPALFDLMDGDGDGIVTLEEATARREARFERFDRNGDGTVTRAEVKRVLASRIDRIFKRIDPDNDGRITRAEFDAGIKGRFARFDQDSDGRVTRLEFDRTRQDWQVLRARMRQMGREFWGGPAKQ